MSMKTLKISENTHKKLKIFCAENSVKMNEWVEVLINKEINENTKPQKKLSQVRN